MPGGTARTRFEPERGLTWPAALVLILTCSSYVATWLLEMTIGRWAHKSLAAGHWYQLRRGGVTYYLSPAMGWYLDHDLWIYFIGLALFLLIAFLGGVRWKRVG